MPPSKILIIEDERPLGDALASILKSEGSEVSLALDGRRRLKRARDMLPDVIVLDLLLPLLPGLEVCRSLRAEARTRTIPIIITSVEAEERDQLIGFAMGADDYVTKPFRMKVLIERIKRLVARRRAELEPPSGTVIETQGLHIKRYGHRAAYRGKEMQLTPSEFRLLEVMAQQPGRAFTRFELMELALGENTVVQDRTIDVHIKSLRKKPGKGAELIETVRNLGYRFREPGVDELSGAGCAPGSALASDRCASCTRQLLGEDPECLACGGEGLVDVDLGMGQRDEGGLELAAREIDAADEHLPEEAGIERRVAPPGVVVVMDGLGVEEQGEHAADALDHVGDAGFAGEAVEAGLEAGREGLEP
jgi:two-component system phosphate regulon response regulator PhoB